MSFFAPQNPGISGLSELTDAEELFLTTFASLTYNEGDVLTIVSGSPTWIEPSGGTGGEGGTPAWGAITGTLSDQTDLQTALNGKAPALGTDDNYVTDAEKAALHSHSNKIALDAVSGVNTGDQNLSGYSLTSHTHIGVYEPADATILKDADIGVTVAAQGHNHDGVYAPVLGLDDNYVTDAEKTKLANLSGTNTGDQVIPDQLSDLTDDTTHRLVTDTEKSTWSAKQNALAADTDYLTPTTASTTYEPKKGADDNYVTDAQLAVIGDTSGTNTGDNATNTQYSGLATSKQDTLVSGTNIKTINSQSLLGSGDIVIEGGAGGGLTAPQVASLISIRF
jgi:hypothetical protein